MTAADRIGRAQGRVAAAGGAHIGDLVTWNAHDVDVKRDAVRAVFEDNGFGNLVPDLEASSALSRAVAEERAPDNIIVESFAQPNKDTPVAYGVYVRQSGQGEGGDQIVCGARVRIDPVTSEPVALAPEGRSPTDDAIQHADRIAVRARHLIGYAKAKDLGSAQIAALKQLGAVPFRDKGGVYLLPPSKCERWAKVADALREMGIDPVRVQMHDAPSNVAAAATAARSSLETEMAELRTDLEKAATDGMRQSALSRRVDATQELLARVELFRSVLQDSADGLVARAQKLHDAFVKGTAGQLTAFDLEGDAPQNDGDDVSPLAATEPPPVAGKVEEDPFGLEASGPTTSRGVGLAYA